jgi:ubiquinone biosynthesis protein
MLSIRKIGVVGRTYRHLNRYRQILAVLFKYGFGDLIDRLKIDQYIEIGRQLIAPRGRERLDRLSRAERVRLAVEELGPTAIKLGQMLSTRPDLVAVEFLEEFAKLQDKVPPFDFAEVQCIATAEICVPLETVFSRFDEQPLASASIGQVHRAVLLDGDQVAVKIQRPGIRKIIEVDLEIMLHLATLMERHIEEMALQRPVRIVEEFARTLEKEIDYTLEAANMERVAAQFLNDPTVYIPKVYRELSSSRVLVTEFVSGIKISDIEALDRAGFDRRLLTDRGADLYLKQIFEFGFFHADPHPGNIFVLADHVICLVDFGMAGAVDLQTREDFVDLITSVVNREETAATAVLLKITEWESEPDMRALGQEVADFMGRHLYRQLKELDIGMLLKDLLELTSRFRLRIPPNLFLMMKALATVEGVAQMLDPGFDMVAKARPFVRQVVARRYAPERIAGDAVRLLESLKRFAENVPRDLTEITGLIRQRKLPLPIEHQGLGTLRSTLDQISNRIAFSIVIAALIIGSALIVISESPPLFFGISLIGIIGFFAAALMGVWLLVAILKRGRL